MGEVNTTGYNCKGKYNVAIVDGFYSKNQNIDNDEKPDISHGDLIKRYYKANNPDINIFEYDTDGNISGYQDQESIANNLEKIAKRIEKGEKIDAVNISISNDQQYDRVSAIIGENLDNNNLKDQKFKIREQVELSNIYERAKKVINGIEKITAKGVPVFVAGGNKENKFNLYSVAKGVTVVGAKDCNYNNYTNKAANNSGINTYESGQIVNNPVFSQDDHKILGYDINGDGEVDIKASELTGKSQNPTSTLVWGSSFATPQAVLKKFQQDKLK